VAQLAATVRQLWGSWGTAVGQLWHSCGAAVELWGSRMAALRGAQLLLLRLLAVGVCAWEELVRL
jgi:hypothetical protein